MKRYHGRENDRYISEIDSNRNCVSARITVKDVKNVLSLLASELESGQTFSFGFVFVVSHLPMKTSLRKRLYSQMDRERAYRG